MKPALIVKKVNYLTSTYDQKSKEGLMKPALTVYKVRRGESGTYCLYSR